MASTSTNKQPLLIDRVFHNTVDSNTLASGSDTSLDILGTNSSAVLLNCSTNDGGIIEDIYTVARGDTAYTVLLYLSTAADYLRSTEAAFVGQIVTATSVGAVISFDDSPMEDENIEEISVMIDEVKDDFKKEEYLSLIHSVVGEA